MATERIVIVISEDGSRVVKRNIQDVGNTAISVGNQINFLQRTLRTLGIGIGVAELIRLADTFTSIQNRIRVVTNSVGELNAVQDRLFEIAKQTRGEFEATAAVYSRAAFASQGLGISQAELLDFTKSLNEATVISGARTQEATNALIQLTQALSSGKLAGDEFRAVSEQLPFVMNIIQKSLGVTRGELLKMREAGQITAEVIFKAFRDAREEIENKFARVVPTVGQAFNVLKTSFIEFLGKVNDSVNANTAFARLILFLADHIDILARTLGAVIVLLGVLAGARAIGAVINAVNLLGVAIATNPIGVLLSTIPAIIGVMVAFSDKILVVQGGLANLQDFATAVWEQIKIGFNGLLNAVQTGAPKIQQSLRDAFDPKTFSFKTFVEVIAAGIDAIIGLFQFLGGSIGIILSGIVSSFQTVFEGVKAGDFQGTVDRLASIGSDVGAAFSANFKKSLDVTVAQDFVDKIFVRAEQLAKIRLAKRPETADLTIVPPAVPTSPPVPKRSPFQEILDDLLKQNTILKTSNEERAFTTVLLNIQDKLNRELTASEAELIVPIIRQNIELERQNRLVDSVRGPREDAIQKYEDVFSLLLQGRISAEEYTRAMRDLNVELTSFSNTVGGGVLNGLARVAQQANVLGQQVSDTIVQAFDAATNAVVDFFRNGDISLRGLGAVALQVADQIAESFLRLATQQLFAGLVGGLPGFATGGQFAVAGTGGVDSQLVAFRATPGERVTISTPGQESPGGGRNEPIVVQSPPVNVYNVTDPKEVARGIRTPDGEREIINVISRNASTIRRALG